MDSMPRICKMLRQKLKASAVLYRVTLQKQELFRQEPGKTADDRRRRDQILDAVGLQHGRGFALVLQYGGAGGTDLLREITGCQAVALHIFAVYGAQLLLGELGREQALCTSERLMPCLRVHIIMR